MGIRQCHERGAGGRRCAIDSELVEGEDVEDVGRIVRKGKKIVKSDIFDPLSSILLDQCNIIIYVFRKRYVSRNLLNFERGRVDCFLDKDGRNLSEMRVMI